MFSTFYQVERDNTHTVSFKFSTVGGIADLRYLRMISCARINDFDTRECQEYCIDNPRMKCREAIRCTAGYAYAYGAYRDRYLCFLLRPFPYLYKSYCKIHAEDETRNFDKRKLTSFGKLSGMQVDNIVVAGNFTNISRIFYVLVNCISHTADDRYAHQRPLLQYGLCL